MSEIFRTRDLIIILLFIYAVYHCWYEPHAYRYEIEPTWFISNPKLQVTDETIPYIPPVFTDFDGDGNSEVLITGPGCDLTVSFS